MVYLKFSPDLLYKEIKIVGRTLGEEEKIAEHFRAESLYFILY